VIPLNTEISIKEKSRKLPVVNWNEKPATLSFVEVDQTNKAGKYIRYPERNELNQDINETYVVEWYNRLVK
jgi:small subunit ribosomal protein S4